VVQLLILQEINGFSLGCHVEGVVIIQHVLLVDSDNTHHTAMVQSHPFDRLKYYYLPNELRIWAI